MRAGSWPRRLVFAALLHYAIYLLRFQRRMQLRVAQRQELLVVDRRANSYDARARARYRKVHQQVKCFPLHSPPVMERFPYPYNNRICYYDAVIEQIQSIYMLL